MEASLETRRLWSGDEAGEFGAGNWKRRRSLSGWETGDDAGGLVAEKKRPCMSPIPSR